MDDSGPEPPQSIGRRGYKALLVLADWASYAILAGMALVVSVDVACRYFLGFSTQIAEEVASLGLVALMFVALAGAFEDDSFLRVDVCYNIMPAGLKQVLDPVFHLIALAVTVTYIIYLGKLVTNSYLKDIRSDSIIGTPNYLTQSVMVFGLGVLGVAILAGLARALAGTRSAARYGDHAGND